MNSYEVLKQPIITEKSTKLSENGKYTFDCAKGATKIDVKKAVEEIFNVHVVKVNVIKCLPKKKRVGRYTGYAPALNKAVVTLAKGEKIDIYAK